MRKWWKRLPKPDRPAIDLPIKHVDGSTVGRIIIGPDGTFVGHVDMEKFYTQFSRPAAFGLISGAKISPIVSPPKPPWERK